MTFLCRHRGEVEVQLHPICKLGGFYLKYSPKELSTRLMPLIATTQFLQRQVTAFMKRLYDGYCKSN
jgi:hypothetical protein